MNWILLRKSKWNRIRNFGRRSRSTRRTRSDFQRERNLSVDERNYSQNKIFIVQQAQWLPFQHLAFLTESQRAPS